MTGMLPLQPARKYISIYFLAAKKDSQRKIRDIQVVKENEKCYTERT